MFNFRNCGLSVGLFLKMFSVVELRWLVFSVFSRVSLLIFEVWLMFMIMLFGLMVLIIVLLMICCVVVEVVSVMIRKFDYFVKVIGFVMKV